MKEFTKEDLYLDSQSFCIFNCNHLSFSDQFCAHHILVFTSKETHKICFDLVNFMYFSYLNFT